MSAPLIGMSFLSFLVLLILSAIAAAVLHWVFRYRLVSGIDGFLGQWMVAWLGAWLGPAVLGHWFDSFILWNIYILPAQGSRSLASHPRLTRGTCRVGVDTSPLSGVAWWPVIRSMWIRKKIGVKEWDWSRCSCEM